MQINPFNVQKFQSAQRATAQTHGAGVEPSSEDAHSPAEHLGRTSTLAPDTRSCYCKPESPWSRSSSRGPATTWGLGLSFSSSFAPLHPATVGI